MKLKCWPPVLLAVLSVGCSMDYFPDRVDLANNSVISFLINYVTIQTNIFGLTRRYDENLAPGGRSKDWQELSQNYAILRANQYSCSFDTAETRFAVTCTPKPSSGLRISFYVDESRTIRMSGEDVAGPGSAQLRLSRDDELKLFGQSRSPR